SETSGDFVGACEHPTRIPTTSRASDAKYTGKVLILDLPNHASSCFDRMHTLLPHSAPRLPRRTGHMSSLGLEICRLRLTLPMAPTFQFAARTSARTNSPASRRASLHHLAPAR